MVAASTVLVERYDANSSACDKNSSMRRESEVCSSYYLSLRLPCGQSDIATFIFVQVRFTDMNPIFNFKNTSRKLTWLNNNLRGLLLFQMSAYISYSID